MNSLLITLTEPIETADYALKTLELPPIRAIDLKVAATSKNSIEFLVLMISSMTGVPVAVLDRLCLRDIQALRDALEESLKKSPSDTPQS